MSKLCSHCHGEFNDINAAHCPFCFEPLIPACNLEFSASSAQISANPNQPIVELAEKHSNSTQSISFGRAAATVIAYLIFFILMAGLLLLIVINSIPDSWIDRPRLEHHERVMPSATSSPSEP